MAKQTRACQCRWLLTDSQGFVCARSAVDVQSGCCSSGEQFTCKTCAQRPWPARAKRLLNLGSTCVQMLLVFQI